MHRLSLQFLKISLQIANCREEPRGDRFASDCILSQPVQSLWVMCGTFGGAYVKIPTFLYRFLLPSPRPEFG
jgi:hypothetical protein